MVIIIVISTVFYVLSLFGCIAYMADRNLEPNILTLLISMCPFLNTFFALKAVNFKETIQKLKGGEK